MALYKDVEGYRKLFDEEYKKTITLISEGETHLDNLAEGFSEASRVIDRIPTADVVPKSEVKKIFKEFERLMENNEVWFGQTDEMREEFAELKKKYTGGEEKGADDNQNRNQRDTAHQ